MGVFNEGLRDVALRAIGLTGASALRLGGRDTKSTNRTGILYAFVNQLWGNEPLQATEISVAWWLRQFSEADALVGRYPYLSFFDSKRGDSWIFSGLRNRIALVSPW